MRLKSKRVINIDLVIDQNNKLNAERLLWKTWDLTCLKRLGKETEPVYSSISKYNKK